MPTVPSSTHTNLLGHLSSPIAGLQQHLVQVGEDVVLQEEVKYAWFILVAPQNVLCTGGPDRMQLARIRYCNLCQVLALSCSSASSTKGSRDVFCSPAIVLIVSTTTARLCSVTTSAQRAGGNKLKQLQYSPATPRVWMQ